jgi:hypothetical protein
LDTVDGAYNKTGYQFEHRDDGFAITVGLQEHISGWSVAHGVRRQACRPAR